MGNKQKQAIRPRRASPPRTFEQKIQRKAENLLWSKIKDHPELEAAYIKRWLGVDIPVTTESDRIKAITAAKAEEARQRVVDSGLKDLENDPMYKELQRAMVFESMGQGKMLRRGDLLGETDDSSMSEYGYGDNNPDTLLSKLDEIEEFEERMSARAERSGQGGMGSLFTPQNVSGLIALVTAIFGKGGMPAPTSNRVYIVPYNGQMIEMTEENYRAYLAQLPPQPPVGISAASAVSSPPVTSVVVGVPIPQPAGSPVEKNGSTPPVQVVSANENKQPVAMAGTSFTPPVNNPGGSSPAVSNPFVAQVLKQFKPMIDELQLYMDDPLKSPVDYFTSVVQKAEQGDYIYQAIFKFMAEHTYEQILEVVKPYQEDAEVKPLLQKVESKKEWVMVVLERAHSMANGEGN